MQVEQVSLTEDDMRLLCIIMDAVKDHETLAPDCLRLAHELAPIFWSFHVQLESATYRGQQLRLFMGVQPAEED